MGFIGKGKLGWAIYEVDFIRFVNYIGYIIIDIKVKSFFFFFIGFCSYDDYVICFMRIVDGCCSCIFKDFYRFNVIRVDCS